MIDVPLIEEEKAGVKEGDTFDSEEQAKQAVISYATYGGFSVRVGKKKAGEEMRMVCSRAGAPVEKKQVPGTKQRNRASMKCGCKWSVSFHCKGGKWIVTSRNNEHTGGCQPSADQLRVTQRKAGNYIPYSGKCTKSQRPA